MFTKVWHDQKVFIHLRGSEPPEGAVRVERFFTKKFKASENLGSGAQAHLDDLLKLPDRPPGCQAPSKRKPLPIEDAAAVPAQAEDPSSSSRSEPSAAPTPASAPAVACASPVTPAKRHKSSAALSVRTSSVGHVLKKTPLVDIKKVKAMTKLQTDLAKGVCDRIWLCKKMDPTGSVCDVTRALFEFVKATPDLPEEEVPVDWLRTLAELSRSRRLHFVFLVMFMFSFISWSLCPSFQLH